MGGFLNRYDFAYADVIKGATNEMNNIAQQRINQIISHGSKEIKRVLPKVLRGVIEDVYQTTFGFLENF